MMCQLLLPDDGWSIRLKRKSLLLLTLFHLVGMEGRYLEVNDNNDFNITVKGERCSCWCVLFIDEGVKIDAKIIHKGRGKFKILEDRYMGKYINKIVDASDVIRWTEIS